MNCCDADDSIRELFGPLLPILPVVDLDEAIQFINGRSAQILINNLLLYDCRDHPLVLYSFCSSEETKVKSKFFYP